MQRTIMTMDEVSRLTRTPVATLRYWRHMGSGPRSYKIGRRVVYDESDVVAWIAAQRSAGHPQGAA